jgi:acyl-CoA synthetase (AMP-forming)/AMP-acid ligase II
VLTPFWLGCRSTLMDPLRFLQRPLDWLRMVEQEQATITSAPNFAYEICARAAETDKEPLDLASLTAAVCGGEPVLPSTVRRFIAAFAPAGFRPSAFAPSYGLAEATLLVASGRTETGPRFVEAPVESNKPILEVADLGAPVSGVACRIVDESGSEVAEGTVGEIEVTGESVGLILGELPGLPLNTGDLGFFREGRLCVAGRKKELIILRGQNIYPSDVEAAALEAHPAIAPGGVAAVGIGADGTQKLVVAVELDRKASPSVEELARLRRLVGEQVSRRVGFVPENVVVCRFGTLPRTTSGKIQRGETALRLSAGTLADLAPTPPMEHTTEKV